MELIVGHFIGISTYQSKLTVLEEMQQQDEQHSEWLLNGPSPL